MEKLKPDATGIYVAAHQAPGAIEEAIEAEVPLIVAVAEHLPIHDIMRVRRYKHSYGQPTDSTRLFRYSKLSPSPVLLVQTVLV
jgi:succinyl-CoA synthetase alpha subunit